MAPTGAAETKSAARTRVVPNSNNGNPYQKQTRPENTTFKGLAF
jgi:hypothetical protein